MKRNRMKGAPVIEALYPFESQPNTDWKMMLIYNCLPLVIH